MTAWAPGKTMRLWTIHPRYLDARGLVAVWREGLLAQAVLLGRTRGYRHHPQLTRFREQRVPVAAVATYLAAVHAESMRRGYHFDRTKIQRGRVRPGIPETRGQLDYEWRLLKAKIQARCPAHAHLIAPVRAPAPHPLFKIVTGAIRPWEKQK